MFYSGDDYAVEVTPEKTLKNPGVMLTYWWQRKYIKGRFRRHVKQRTKALKAKTKVK